MDNYELLHEVGDGSYGTVREAIRKTDGLKVALKIIPVSKVTYRADKSVSEINTLERSQMDGVVKLLDSFEAQIGTGQYIVIVMELCNGCDLFDYTREKRSVAELLSIAKQIVDVMVRLEKIGVYHNDVKEENCMIYKGVATLVDFGAASLVGDENVNFTGTELCAPPEWLANKNNYDPKSATPWSVGVMLANLLCGKFVFKTHSSITDECWLLPDDVAAIISDELRQVINGCLSHQPNERPSLSDILTALL